ncbi:ABC transporter ATP-binding protein [bacterium]|nr:ABC transporter ATP-binding protein [bacterium]
MIHIKNLSAGYADKEIFKDLNLDFSRAEFVSILGPNGAGKSTLLKLINGFMKPESGEILIAGKRVDKWAQQDLAKIVTYIPQENFIQYNFTVEEIILMGRFPFISIWQNYSSLDREIVEKIIHDLDLQQLRHKFINQLSGGEKQRTLIARAIAQDSDYILLDETFSHLDINHQIEILNIMKDLHIQKGKSIIMVSHNINLSANYSQRMIALKDGKLIADDKPEEVMTSENLEKLFDIKLGVVTNPLTLKPNIIYP